MHIISSKMTFFMKRVFPVFWLGMVVFALVAGFDARAWKDPVFFLGPILMGVIGMVVFRKFLWDLADHVEDHGDFLRVRRGAVEERVNLADVLNVSMSQFVNPPRLSLRLRKAGRLGDEIAFIPKASALRLNPFARDPIAERLLQRVDRLRNAGGTR